MSLLLINMKNFLQRKQRPWQALTAATALAFSMFLQQQNVYARNGLAQPKHERQAEIHLSGNAIQQIVSGRVEGEPGVPLSGVSVVNQTTGAATATDDAGRFTLAASVGDVIQFSFMGYQTREILFEGKAIDVVMEAGVSAMDEVVVTAIGIMQQKRKIGYATQEVKPEVLQQSKTMNVGSALSGQVAGLIVNNPTGIFQAPTFSLRGNTPLIVIDNIPVETDFYDIPSQNIESINVLKGTAASALYGSRGKNGAIMITTKQAKGDRLEISVGTTNMFSAGFTVFPESQSEFGSGSNGKYEFWDGADGGISDGDMTWGPKLDIGLKIPQWNSPIRDKVTGEEIPWWGDVSGTIYEDKSRYERVPIDWVSYDNLGDFLGTGIITENNMTVSYKTEKARIFVSGKYAFQQGQVPNSKLHSGGVNMNSSYHFSDNLQLDVNLSYNKVNSPNYPRYGYGPRNHMYTILLWMGNDVNGQDLKKHMYIPGQEGYRQANYNYAWYNNPYFANTELTQHHDRDILHGQGSLTWRITPKLTLSGRAAARQHMVFEDMKSPKSYMNYGDSRNGDYKMWTNNRLNFDADILASYNEQFSDNFGLTINAGSATFARTLRTGHQSTDGLVVPFVYSLNNTQGPVRAENHLEEKVIRSAYGSVSFDLFRSTYLNFSGRNDWSSTLAKDNYSYFYPAVSLSTMVSDYFRLPEQIDFVKLYSSWAQVSNDLDPYRTSATYVKDVTYGSTPSVSYPEGIVNPDILPEKSTSLELGAAFALFKNRLSVDFTYYNITDENQIIDLSISEASAFKSRKVNGNKYRTNGYEVMLSATPVQHQDFQWNFGLNWTHSVKRLTEIYGSQSKFGNLQLNDRADAYYDQVWQKSADGQVILNPNTGMPIRDTYPTILGHFRPDWQFGFTNTFRIKDFTVNLDIDGSIGGVMRSQTIEKMWWGGKHPSSTLHRQAEYDAGQNVYKPEGVVVTGGELVRDVNGNVVSDTRTYQPFADAVSWQTWSQIYPYQARVSEDENEFFANVYDRSFVKLRRLSIGYDLNKLIKSTRMRSLDASLFGYNLAMWKNIPYVDPDFGIGNDDNLQDPSTRYIGLSLNVKF